MVRGMFVILVLWIGMSVNLLMFIKCEEKVDSVVLSIMRVMLS